MSISPPTPAQNTTSPSEIASLVTSWRLSLSARRFSPATIATYTSSILLLRDYLAGQGMPTAVELCATGMIASVVFPKPGRYQARRDTPAASSGLRRDRGMDAGEHRQADDD